MIRLALWVLSTYIVLVVAALGLYAVSLGVSTSVQRMRSAIAGRRPLVRPVFLWLAAPFAALMLFGLVLQVFGLTG